MSPITLYLPFITNLASAASEIILDPSSNEITGFNLINNCIDPSSNSGQALSAIIIEAQNSTQLSNGGINNSGSTAPNPTPLPLPPTGTNTIGGGLNS